MKTIIVLCTMFIIESINKEYFESNVKILGNLLILGFVFDIINLFLKLDNRRFLKKIKK